LVGWLQERSNCRPSDAPPQGEPVMIPLLIILTILIAIMFVVLCLFSVFSAIRENYRVF
jgi:hypothetical protein